MKKDYYIYNISSIDEDLFEVVEEILDTYPKMEFLINLPSTKSLSIEDIERFKKIPSSKRISIRIESCFDDDRLKRYKQKNIIDNRKYDVVYTLDEMELILKKIKKIEENLKDNWLPEHKLMYFISYLRNKVIYHPSAKEAPSHEIRSLRGLISNQTVCVGYAIILKELCERNDIKCEFVEGSTTIENYKKGIYTHAWNIIELNGYKFPIDLTWFIGKQNDGQRGTFEDLANVNRFVKRHFPSRYEQTQDYQTTLKSLDGEYIRHLELYTNTSITYDTMSYELERSDGTKFEITLVSEDVIEDKKIFKYVYSKIENNKKTKPIVLFCETNIIDILSDPKIYKKLKHELTDVLFSKRNLVASYVRKDCFIGALTYEKNDQDEITASEVYLDLELANKIKESQKIYTRTDGTSFTLHKIGKSEHQNYYAYYLYEHTLEEGKYVVKRDRIVSDEEIFSYDDKKVANELLGRKYVDERCKNHGGYIGYYSKEGKIEYSELEETFTSYLFKKTILRKEHIIDYYPDLDFELIKKLVSEYKYEKDEIINIRTGKIVRDVSLIKQIKFAFLWLKATKTTDPIAEYQKAFGDYQEKIYTIITSMIENGIKKYDIINTIEIYLEISKLNDETAKEIVVSILKDEESIKIIYDAYHLQNRTVKPNKSYIPTTLKDQLTALQLSRTNQKSKKIYDLEDQNGIVRCILKK